MKHIENQAVKGPWLSQDDKVELLADAPLAPVWIADVMRRIAQDGS